MSVRIWSGLLMAGVAVAMLMTASGCGKQATDTGNSVGASNGPKGTTPPGDADTSKPKGPSAEKAPEYSLTAPAFRRYFKGIYLAEQSKYEGKLIELSGVIKRMGSNQKDGVGRLELDAGKDEFSVTCWLLDKHPWRKHVPGQQVKVRGTGDGADLRDAVIVEAGEIPAPRLTAKQFAAQFAKDPEKLAEKYKKKWFILTGEIVAINTEPRPHPRVFLKGDGKRQLQVSYNFYYNFLLKEPLKVGQIVELQAPFMSYEEDEDLLRFYESYVMRVLKLTSTWFDGKNPSL